MFSEVNALDRNGRWAILEACEHDSLFGIAVERSFLVPKGRKKNVELQRFSHESLALMDRRKRRDMFVRNEESGQIHGPKQSSSRK